ncbi:MAG: tetrapyrrole methylase family protein / MazG family protein [Chloroflexia bacterium]|jgi:tetrapyrrole methylase family protein/MazG family protein|nr:tetrapyrrole methylase family protein / MazG family protein [Chloroflexia bacterium]
MPSIIVAGLGPGAWEQVTLEVKSLLESAGTVYLRTSTHPTAEHLPAHLDVRTFDHLYEREDRFEEIYRKIAEELVSIAVSSSQQQIIYCVPGHPAIGEASVRHLRTLAAERGIEIRLVAGLSFLEPVCTALGIDPLHRGLQIVDGTELAGFGEKQAREPSEDEEPFLFSPYSLPVEPSAFPAMSGLTPLYPVLLCQVYNDRVASACKLMLMERYPDEHPVQIVLNAGVPGQEQVISTTLAEMDRGHGINHLACVYIPSLEPLQLPREFDSLVYVMGRLRGPGGCPWDREQTHHSIKHHLLEEAYEAVDAMDAGDPDTLAEELGDLLLQVVFHSQLAVSNEEFTLSDVISHIVTKLVRRHPHVFGDVEVTGAEHVLRNWEMIKAGEREAKAKAGRKFDSAEAANQGLEGTGLLLSVPRAMPSLDRAQQLQVRAARVGFDWSGISGIYDKVREELEELRVEESVERRTEELGDLLFVLVNLGKWMGINAEEALRRANDKFLNRFMAMERAIVGEGKKLRDMNVEEMDRYWDRIKGVAGKG